MQKVKLEDAGSNISALVEAALRGEEVYITKDGEASVQLVPRSIERRGVRRKPQFGSAKGLISISDDFDEPLADFEATAGGGHQPRPFGLCAGEFVVPDDFDAPLPDEVLAAFER